jgi:predicted dehydrogenase
MSRSSRREFLEQSMWAAAAAAGPAMPALASGPVPKVGPNDRVNVAVVGTKGRGMTHVNEFSGLKDSIVAALVDIDDGVIGPAMKASEQKGGKKPGYQKDIRRVLDNKDIDAVSIATTNHTHSLYAIWAMQAGKHVYVEKPASHNIFEGRKAIEASRKYGMICQVGMQSRSNPGMRQAIEFLHSGKLGRIKIARGLCYKSRKSIGRFPDEPVPAGVDYDLWLGPAPVRPFNKNRFHYNWHWFWDYGNGDIGNQGVHELDRCRWGLGKKTLPTKVVSLGGRLGYEDAGETANTQVAWMDYGDAQLIFEVRGLNTDKYMGAGVGVIYHCENGYMVNPNYSSATAFDPDGKKIESFQGGTDAAHFQNFVKAINSGKHTDLNCDIEEGHLSAALCHLANASYRLGKPADFSVEAPFGELSDANETYGRFRKHLGENKVDLGKAKFALGPLLAFDPRTEKFTGNDDANKLITREYRKPYVVPDQV